MTLRLAMTPTAGALTSGKSFTAPCEIATDVVVVGSGAGGATVAAELAEAGYRVVVVEEGSYVSTEEFTATPSTAIARMYRDAGASVALGVPPVLYQEGRVVGGSTVINGGMSWRTPEAVLARWQRDHQLPAIDAAAMEPFFARVERRISVGTQAPDSIGRDNELLQRGAQQLGWRVVDNLRNQHHCPGSNNCAFGCPTGAKQSALVTYLPRALHFGATLLSDIAVSRVLTLGKRAIGIVGVARGDDQQRHRVTIYARLVIVACGAIATPALLARSKIRPPSNMTGRRLSLHPNVKMIAQFDAPIKGWHGVHQAFQVREFQARGLLFAAVNLPPGLVAMGLGKTGADLAEVMATYDRMMISGMLLEDSSHGRVCTLAGRPQAFYQLSRADAARLQQGMGLLAQLLFAAGARAILPPFAGAPTLRHVDDVAQLASAPMPRRALSLFTVHMMGTAAMGPASRAVTNAWGAVHDCEGLYVTDASVFPGPIGVNPMETIMALATRTAAHLIDNHRGWWT